jgi:putative spermidine/putrescine transport system substrate-binding protein
MTATGGVALLLQVAKELTGDYNNLDPAFEKMRELRQSILEFVESAGAWETFLQQGDLWLGVNSYTRGVQFTNAKMPVGVVFPKEGVPSYDISMGIVDGAPHPKAAHAWINHLLKKGIQEIIVEKTGYRPSTVDAVIPQSVAHLLPNAEQSWFPNWKQVSTRFAEIVDRWQREVER